MPIINAILPELDHESKATVRMLERVPTEHLSWKPHAKSTALGQLAWHIATVPARIQKFLRLGTFDVTQGGPSPAPPNDAAAIVDEFRRNFDDTRAYLATLSDDDLHETFTMLRGEQVLMSIPKLAAIRSILMNHTYHHRGQLSVYLRLLDVPVPATYGTSADEGM